MRAKQYEVCGLLSDATSFYSEADFAEAAARVSASCLARNDDESCPPLSFVLGASSPDK